MKYLQEDVIRGRYTNTSRDKAVRPFRPEEYWKESSALYAQDASGKRFPRSMGAEARSIGDFRNGKGAGFFERIWAKGLERYDELEGIGWEWQSVDGCMVKAPLAREFVGRNPTGCGKNGHKTLGSHR